MFRRRGESNQAPSGAEGASKASAKGASGTKPDAAPKNEPFTYIQRGTTISGQVEATGRVRVHGVIRGDVKVDGALEVAQSGLVEGNSIEADEVKIIGRVVVKRLVARGKVEIWDGGELVGDVTAARLDIEEGARFTGRSEMLGGKAGAADGQSGLAGEPAGASAGTDVAGDLLDASAVGRSVERP